jgi:hypothetical protein
VSCGYGSGDDDGGRYVAPDFGGFESERARPTPALKPDAPGPKVLTTGADWKALVERINIGCVVGDFMVSLIEADAPLGVMLTIYRRTRDVHAPDTFRSNTVAYKVEQCAVTEREACRYIRDLIAANLAHEVDEFFRLDGERIFDPHAVPVSEPRASFPVPGDVWCAACGYNWPPDVVKTHVCRPRERRVDMVCLRPAFCACPRCLEWRRSR